MSAYHDAGRKYIIAGRVVVAFFAVALAVRWAVITLTEATR